MTNYNSWPLGQVPKEFQRPELDLIREKGYEWNDPRDVVDIFEKKVAAFAGSKYAVACDCCSHGIFLCLKYLSSFRRLTTVTIPKNTYVSIPMQIKFAGFDVSFRDEEWSGIYQLKPFLLFDGAVRWTKGMYNGGYHVVSFQYKKRVPIGKGGMILTDNKDAYNWLKLATYDGRNLNTTYDDPDHVKIIGWHFFMTPEDAARGILLMDQIPEVNEDSGCWKNYPDVSKMKVFQND